MARLCTVDRAYADLNEALGDDYDAAVISTPAPTHIPIARELVHVGTHVLIEKPLSTSLDGVEALQQEVADRGLVAAVGYSLRAHPVFELFRDTITSGRLGQPLQITVVSGHPFAYLRPAYRETYYRDRSLGGGAIQDALTHMLNLGEWFVGPIDRLITDCDHLALEGVEVEDTVHVLTRHGPVMGCFSLNQHQAPTEVSFTVVCEQGTVCAELHRSLVRWMVEPEGEWEITELAKIDRDVMYVRQAKAFLDAAEGTDQPLCTLSEGIQTLKANLAALASSENHDAWRCV